MRQHGANRWPRVARGGGIDLQLSPAQEALTGHETREDWAVQDRKIIELQLRDLGDGTVHLKLQHPVPSALAEQIMALLQRSPVGERPSLAALESSKRSPKARFH
jgi:hypothetical protein